MVAVEALQDPFMHMYSTDIDEENFKSMDVSNLNRITLNQFQRRAKNFLTTQEEDLLGKPKDVGQVMKKNPGFDPVFMKVWNILVAMENWKIVMFADFET